MQIAIDIYDILVELHSKITAKIPNAVESYSRKCLAETLEDIAAAQRKIIDLVTKSEEVSNDVWTINDKHIKLKDILPRSSDVVLYASPFYSETTDTTTTGTTIDLPKGKK